MRERLCGKPSTAPGTGHARETPALLSATLRSDFELSVQPIREKKRSRVRAGGGHSLLGTGSRALLLSSLGMREEGDYKSPGSGPQKEPRKHGAGTRLLSFF